ncbi:MAG TPA: hypothetical protein VFS40_04165, partial [Gemmatimonadales bacterium]|nr:hypothetical protein [Gemmatimonadales bacterium]
LPENPMRLLTHRTTAFLAALALAGGLAACGNPIDAALDFGLEGTWKGIDGLAIEFDGNQAVVTDFGSSPLGTNSSVFRTGQPFLKGISCDENACTAEVVDPEIVDGILQSIGFEGVTIVKDGDRITMRRNDDGETSTFTKAASNPGTGGGGTLATTASCTQWWTAVKAGNPWKVTRLVDPSNERDAPPSKDVQITFSGTRAFTVTNPDAIGWGATKGNLYFDEKIFGTDYCRFVFWATDDAGVETGQMQVWFMKALSGGKLRVNLSYLGEDSYWELQSQ